MQPDIHTNDPEYIQNEAEANTPEPMELRSIEDAEAQGDLEALPPPPHSYSREDVVDLVQATIRFHRGKTGWEVPCVFDDRKFLSDRLIEIVAEAALPNPERRLNQWHDAWLAMQLKDGWKWGEEYLYAKVGKGQNEDGEIEELIEFLQESPIIIPFLFTPPEYQTLGHLVWNTVRGLQHAWDRT